MKYLQYYTGIFQDDAKAKFISGLQEVTEWDAVPLNTPMCCGGSRSILTMYLFKGYSTDENGESSVRFEHSNQNEIDVYPVHSNALKWYYWDEDWWLHIVKESEEGNGRTRLFINAVNNRDGETVDKLISKGFDLEKRDHLGRTALGLAIQKNELQIAKKLIEAGANIARVDDNGQNILHFSCGVKKPKTSLKKQEEMDFIAYLLTLPIPLNVEDCNLRNPFHLLIARRRDLFSPELGLLFKKQSAALHGKDKYGYTPLALAIYHDNIEIIRFLVEEGANINDSNEDAAHIMEFVCHTEVYDFFAERIDQLTPLGREKLEENRLKWLFD